MRHPKNSPNILLPTTEQFVRLGGDITTFIENLNQLDQVYLQARNTGGGLGKVTRASSLQLDPETGIAIDPDNSLCVKMTELIAVHAMLTEPMAGATPGFDFEFASKCAGLSYYAIPGVSPIDEFFSLATEHRGQVVHRDQLEIWREDISSDICLCGECAQAPTAHPIYDILQSLVIEGSSIQCRLLSDHADFSTWMTPGSLTPEGGFLSLADERGEAVVHIDLHYLHALRISNRTLDDEAFAVLEIYDSQGSLNFELLSPDPALAHAWQFACERSHLI